MARTNEEIKVGVVVAFSALLFLVALVFVGGVNLLRKPKAEYTAYFKFAGGLEPGSMVRFGGLKVGTIKSASLDPEDRTRIRIVLQVEADTPIRANSTARISSLGFLERITLRFPPAPAMRRCCPQAARYPPRKSCRSRTCSTTSTTLP